MNAELKLFCKNITLGFNFFVITAFYTKTSMKKTKDMMWEVLKSVIDVFSFRFQANW